MRELCFLAPSCGNAFQTEILRAVAGAVAELGVPTRVELDRYPPFDDDTVYVAIPHEFFVLAPDGGAPSPGHLRRTVGFCVELPGTVWFAETCHYAQQLGGLVDIRRSGVEAMHALGLEAVHAPLGYTPAWDAWGGDEAAPRPVDVLYLGATDLRRDRLLAGYARTLERRASRLVIAPAYAKPQAGPSFLVGEAKHRLLARSRTLLNVHREGAQGLEWPRVLEAICNGCVVVTERSLDVEPLRLEEHLVAGRGESLALLADRLLEDPDRLRAMRRDAYDFVRAELPMSLGASALVETADRVSRASLRRASSDGLRPLPAPEGAAAAAELEDTVAPVRAALKRLVIEVGETRRELAGIRDGSSEDGPRVEPVAVTPAYASARPRVTVAISLFNYEKEVRTALESVAASQYDDYEVLVLDDASTDGSRAAARAFLEAHPWMPAALLAHSRNGGLARARNTLTARARGELLFVLDADNGLYPRGLGRLVQALDAHLDAAFAYPIIAVLEDGRPSGLLSVHDWDLSLLRRDNPVDAMSLVRRETLLDVGGYCEDPRLVGWEDYDLWCQVAERGGRGAHVPEILAWYRRRAHSMLSLTRLDLSVGRSLLAARAPGVFEGAAAT